MSETEVLARVITGESGVCGLYGMLLIAWIYSRNQTMFGDADPGFLADFVAHFWMLMPDVGHGSRFVFSKQDMAKASVRAIVADRGPPIIVRCRGGLELWAFR